MNAIYNIMVTMWGIKVFESSSKHFNYILEKLLHDQSIGIGYGIHNDFNNTTIGRSHQSKEEKTKLKFIKDKSKEILALTIEWSYEGVHNNYA